MVELLHTHCQITAWYSKADSHKTFLSQDY